MSLIRNTAIQSRQISKRGSTSAAHNSALNTPYPPCHTYSEPSRHKDSPGTTSFIPYLSKKKWANRDEATVFFGLFMRAGAQITSIEIIDFQNWSVLGDFYALYRFLCHRYT